MDETEGDVTIFVSVLMGRLERSAEVELTFISGTALGKSGQGSIATATCKVRYSVCLLQNKCITHLPVRKLVGDCIIIQHFTGAVEAICVWSGQFITKMCWG